MFGIAGGTLFNMLGAGGVTTILLYVVNAVITRKKRGAETDNVSATATKAVADAASGLVDRFEKDNERLRARVEALELFREESALEKEEGRRVLQLHAAWDALVIAALQGANPPITLPPAPPLTPPVITRDHRE